MMMLKVTSFFSSLPFFFCVFLYYLIKVCSLLSYFYRTTFSTISSIHLLPIPYSLSTEGGDGSCLAGGHNGWDTPSNACIRRITWHVYPCSLSYQQYNTTCFPFTYVLFPSTQHPARLPTKSEETPSARSLKSKTC